MAPGLRYFFSQRVEPVHGDHMALEAQPPHAGRRGPPGQVTPAGPLDGHLQVGRLLGRLGAVAAVGGQHRRPIVGEHQQGRVGPGETGQIAHVDQVGDQHRVQFGSAESAHRARLAAGNVSRQMTLLATLWPHD